jgi:8-oxo-dGTP pyrophosphatase MutT (NUDIX family)
MVCADNLTSDHLRQKLAGTRLPKDPTDVVLPDNSDRWPRDVAERLTQSLIPAGVLIPVIERHSELTVLLTRRSAALKHHASQISFPGGRMEEADATIEVTALRETHEDVGIVPAAVSVLGYLEPMPTVTGYAVTPTIGLVSPPLELALDRAEVELAFEVPLPFLLDATNARSTTRHYRGRKIPTVEFHFEGHRIWGATAHMLIKLREKIY